MIYTSLYHSPLGDMLLAADEEGLLGAWFTDQKFFAFRLPKERMEKETGILHAAKGWLDLYFAGNRPDHMPPLHLMSTPFRLAVWEKLLEIPYGKTVTYGDLAKDIAKERGLSRMSAQAIGGAVGHNPISIIIPCHRVLGADGTLTGYAGGVERKDWLLNLEKRKIETMRRREREYLPPHSEEIG